MTKACRAIGCDAPPVAKGLCKRHWHKERRYGAPEGGADWRRGESLNWLKDHASYQGDDCLIWPFTRSASGYGVIYIDGKQRQAHREICRIAHGDPPSDDYQSAHSCGKGHEGCVNQRHLRWATAAENQADRVKHGTSSRGSGNGCSILNEGQVYAIRDRIYAGEKQSDIAADFGVSKSTVHLIKTGRNWGWMEERS